MAIEYLPKALKSRGPNIVCLDMDDIAGANAPINKQIIQLIGNALSDWTR